MESDKQAAPAQEQICGDETPFPMSNGTHWHCVLDKEHVARGEGHLYEEVKEKAAPQDTYDAYSKQAAPVSAGETDFAEELRKTSLVPTSEPESRVGSPYSFDRKVSGGDVKRYGNFNAELKDGSLFVKITASPDGEYVKHSEYAKLQSRIATLEAELARFKALDQHLPAGYTIGDDATAELAVELAAFNDSLPERAEKAANTCLREWDANKWKAIILAEMQRKKE